MNKITLAVATILLAPMLVTLAEAHTAPSAPTSDWHIVATTQVSTITIDPATGVQTASNKLPANGAISPDGKRIARCKTIKVGEAHTTELFVAAIDSAGTITNERQITNGAANATQPQWMPDNHRIVYVRGEGTFRQVYLTNDVDEKWSETRVSAGGVPSHMPRIANDGRIAYLAESGKDGKATTYDLMVVVDKKPTPLVRNATITDYAWSPDSSKIAYSTHGELVIIDVADRSTTVRKFESVNERLYAHHAVSLAWRPDGTALAAVIHFSGGTFSVDGQEPKPSFPETNVFLIPVNGDAKWFAVKVPVTSVSWIKAK